MRRSRTRRRLPRTAVLIVAGGVAVCLGACQSSGPGEAPRQEPPSSVQVRPEPSGPAASTQAPTMPAPKPPALSARAQARLDQELIVAAKANNVAVVAELIGRGGNMNPGADVASTNRYGGTALIPANEHGHVETVRILLAAGVPVNHVNNVGWTAMQGAILLNDGGPRQQEVVRLLLEAGGDPNIRDPGRTTLKMPNGWALWKSPP